MFSFLKGGSKDYKDDKSNDCDYAYDAMCEAIHKAWRRRKK